MSVELTYGECRSLKHAASVLELFVKQSSRGWAHAAVNPTWCERAADRLAQLAESGRPKQGDHLVLYRTAATIAQGEPTGLEMTVRDLLGVAMRIAPLEPVAEVGQRSRRSPLASA